jgi:carbon-monoxide dehydrogenase large subunit
MMGERRVGESGINAVRWVGRPLPRYEDPVLLRGHGRYAADLAKGARILRFLRSPVARGRHCQLSLPCYAEVVGVGQLRTGKR